MYTYESYYFKPIIFVIISFITKFKQKRTCVNVNILPDHFAVLVSTANGLQIFEFLSYIKTNLAFLLLVY